MNDPIHRGSEHGLGRMVLSGSAWLIGARIGRTLITLVGMMVLARLLTPAAFGLLAIAVSATVLSLVVIEGVIDYPSIREDGLSVDILRSLVWAGLGITGIYSLALWLLAPWLEHFFAFPQLATGLRAMIPVCLAQVYFVAGTALLRRQHRFAAAARIQVMTVALYVAISIILALAGWGLWSVLIGQILAQIITAIIVVRTSHLPIGLPGQFGFGGNFHVASWGALSRIVAWGWTSIDTFAVSAMFGPAATGLYSRAYNIQVQAKEPFVAIDQTIRQAFAALKNREGGFVEQNRMALRLVTLLSGFTAAGLIVMRDEVVLLLLGRQWGLAAPALALLAAGLPARIARLYFDSLTLSMGNMRGLVMRHIAILILIAAGIALVGGRGIGWVAAVVSGTLYLSLLFANGASERSAGAGIGAVAQAMAPGLALAVVLVAIAESVTLLVGPVDWKVDALVRAIVMGIGALALFAVPAAWIGPGIADRRKKVLARLGWRR